MSKSFYQLLKENAPFEEIKAAIESGNFERPYIWSPSPLQEAMRTKKIDKRIVLLLIASGANVKEQPIGGHTSMLHEAIHKKLGAEVISALISAGADLSETNFEEATALHIAVEKKSNKATIQALIEAGVDLNAKDTRDRTPLHYAAIYKLPKAVLQLLIDAGADVNAKDRNGSTPLKEAKSYDYQEMVDLLIEHGAKESLFDLIEGNASVKEIKTAIAEGADVNEKISLNKETPLHIAVKKANKGAIQALIEAGADLNAKDKDGNTPLGRAKSSGYLNVNLLIKHGAKESLFDLIEDDASVKKIKTAIAEGADVNEKISYERTPLHIAVYEKANKGTIQALIEAGADLNAKDEGGSTPLHTAAYNRSWDPDWSDYILKVLIESGADVNAKDKYQNTPLHIAVQDVRSLDVIRTLIEAGADVNAKDNYQYTPLHIAVRDVRYLDVIRTLIEAGADVNARDKDDCTPLKILKDKAQEREDREFIEPYFDLLLQAGAEL